MFRDKVQHVVIIGDVDTIIKNILITVRTDHIAILRCKSQLKKKLKVEEEQYF